MNNGLRYQTLLGYTVTNIYLLMVILAILGHGRLHRIGHVSCGSRTFLETALHTVFFMHINKNSV